MRLIKKRFCSEKNQIAKQNESVPARCTETSEDFEIALGYEKGQLTMLKGKKATSPSYQNGCSAQHEKLKTIDLSKGLGVSRTYHCPVCGNKDIVRCGKCHRITCYDGKGRFKCAYCGNSGQVSGTIQSIMVHDFSGMKPQDGMKPKVGKKYYPGDK